MMTSDMIGKNNDGGGYGDDDEGGVSSRHILSLVGRKGFVSTTVYAKIKNQRTDMSPPELFLGFIHRLRLNAVQQYFCIL